MLTTPMDELIRSIRKDILKAMTEPNSHKDVNISPAVKIAVKSIICALDTKYGVNIETNNTIEETYIEDETGNTTNEKKGKKYETVLADILLELGIKETKKLATEQEGCITFSHSNFDQGFWGYKRTLVEKPNKLHISSKIKPDVYFVRHPFGGTNNPDILVFEILDENKPYINSYFGFEVKSGTTVWNTHIQHVKKDMLYVVFNNEGESLSAHYLFGVQIRTKEEFIHALAADHLSRYIVQELNDIAKEEGLRNNNVAYPKHEFRVKNDTFGSRVNIQKFKKEVHDFIDNI
jgi:hypothetical protein